MARHRNVRSMNYSDEYDGYDDVYGHSVEDDFCVSPSEAAFIYDREGSKNQQMGAFIKDIAEEDEQEAQLPENEQAKLESCIAQLKLVLGISASRQEMVEVLCNNDLNVDKALNILLDNVSTQPKQIEKKEKDDNLFQMSTKLFNIPKLNSFNTRKINGDSALNENVPVLQLHISKLHNNDKSKTFSSLGELSSNHLKKLSLDFPKLGSEKSLNLSQELANIKLSEEESTNAKTSYHTSLSDLSSNYLKNLKNSGLGKFKTDKLFGEKHLHCQTDFTTNIGVKIEKDEGDNYHLQQSIDLTKALTKNIWQKSVTVNNKKFDYLHISCENKLENAPDCMLDISSILDASPKISKNVSVFGKILCCKYKKYVPLIINDMQFSKFSFNVPSPDDIILSHLKI